MKSDAQRRVRPRRPAYLLLLLCLLSTTACERFAPTHSVHFLTGEWQYRNGFDPSFLLSAYDSPEWKTTRYPIPFHDAEAMPAYANYRGHVTVRYRIPAHIVAELSELNAAAFYSSWISDVATVYLNDVPFASVGSEQPYVSGYNRFILSGVPLRALRSDADNYLSIHFYAGGTFPLLFLYEDIQLGDADAIYTNFFIYEIVAMCLLCAYFITGQYHFVLYIRRRQEVYNLYFALFSLLLCVYWFFRTNMRDFAFGDLVLLRVRIEYIALYFLAPPLMFFISHLFYKSNSRFGYFALAISLLATVFTAFGSFDVMRFTLFAYDLWMLFAIIVLIGYVAYGAYHRIMDAMPLLIGIVILMSAATHDVLAHLGAFENTHIARYFFLGFVGAIALILANRWVRTQEKVEELNVTLEKKVSDRTGDLRNTLHEIQALKEQQDGDYFLTSLLIRPLTGDYTHNNVVNIDIYAEQKKKFQFRKWRSEIGGDICAAYDIKLHGRPFTAFVNADAMGKSVQGAGGALVIGTAFKAVIARTELASAASNKYPEKWLKDCYTELQNVFISFDGSMLISAVLGLVDHRTGVLYFINAEHPYVTLYRNGKAGVVPYSAQLLKIGIEEKLGPVQVTAVGLRPDDVIIMGSDGRDDLQIGTDDSGVRLLNEDESLFLRHVEAGQGNLFQIYRSILSTGELTDDLSLMRIGYLEDRPAPDVESIDARHDVVLREVEECMNRAQWSRALELLENLTGNLSLEAQMQNAQLQRLLGLVHWHLEHYREAAAHLRMYCELNPADTDTMFYAARACHRADELADAVEYMERIRRRNYRNIENIALLARIYLEAGRRERSLKLVLEILDLAPGHAAAREMLSDLN